MQILAPELNETGQVGLLRLAEFWSVIRAKEGMGGLILKGTEAKILSDVVAQFYACLLYTSISGSRRKHCCIAR